MIAVGGVGLVLSSASEAVAAPAGDRLRPLTERALAALPGPRLLVVAAWALVPWLNAGANALLDTGERSAIWEQSRELVLLNYAAVSLAIVVTLLGTKRIAQRVDELGATTSGVLDGISARGSFREMESVLVPLLATAAAALAFGLTALLGDGVVAATLRGVTWLVIGVPIWTFLWTYAALQLGLNRLGRARLRDDAALVDPGLELRPLGVVAFTGLCLLLVSIVPVLVTGLPDVTGFILGLLVVIGAVAAFVLSLWGLHRQIVELKDDQLALARRLYAEAYAPVRAEPTLDVLERQHSLLGAADSLEKRARSIHDWPIAEGMWVWLIGIGTSIVAIACSRLILRLLGL